MVLFSCYSVDKLSSIYQGNLKFKFHGLYSKMLHLLFCFLFLTTTGCLLSGGTFYVQKGNVLCEKDYRVSQCALLSNTICMRLVVLKNAGDAWNNALAPQREFKS